MVCSSDNPSVKVWTTRRKSGPRDLNPWQLCNRGLIESLWLASHSSHWNLGNDLNDLDGSWTLMGVAMPGKPRGQNPTEDKKGCQFFFFGSSAAGCDCHWGHKAHKTLYKPGKTKPYRDATWPKKFWTDFVPFCPGSVNIQLPPNFQNTFFQNCC